MVTKKKKTEYIHTSAAVVSNHIRENAHLGMISNIFKLKCIHF